MVPILRPTEVGWQKAMMPSLKVGLFFFSLWIAVVTVKDYQKTITPGGHTAMAITPAATTTKNFETLGKGVTQFGDCMPYCDKKKLKSFLPEFLEAYKKKPFDDNMCGCLVNHCAFNFLVAKISGAQTIVENGVNAGKGHHHLLRHCGD